MRAEDLDHKELLELDPEGGMIRFAGQRALLIDAVAMGLLRKYLVENFGITAARTVLTQFGFAHGWRMAEAMRAEFPWESDDEWRSAGTRIHALEGVNARAGASPFVVALPRELGAHGLGHAPAVGEAELGEHGARSGDAEVLHEILAQQPHRDGVEQQRALTREANHAAVGVELQELLV